MNTEPLYHPFLLPACALLTAVSLSPTLALTLQNWGLLCILAWISLQDIQERKIPNRCIAAGLAIWLIRPITEGSAFLPAVWSVILPGALAGSVIVFFCILLCIGLSRITGRMSMGAGDWKLLFLAAAVLGWERSLYMLFLACCFGLLTWEILFLTHGNRREAFPFGPAISAAAALMLFG